MKLILQGQQLNLLTAQQFAAKVNGAVNFNDLFAVIEIANALTATELQILRDYYPFDINAIPEHFNSKQAKLFVTDMDSTLINIECIDEIADFMGIKTQVAEITEAAMQGKIDFESSLRQRVLLLKGLDIRVLEKVYQQRLQLNPGADILLSKLKQYGIKTALVSGGFTFFTDRLKKRLGLDFAMANMLAEHKGKLTGEIAGDICGAKAKAEFLLTQSELLAISPQQTIAIGDGANDLLMMEQAGLSIAYHAKPKVQVQANTRLNHTGLEGVMGLLQLT